MSTPPDVEDLIVHHSDSLREALECIDQTAQGICFVVDTGGRLVGVATDGDIRRGLLEGADLSDHIQSVMETDFVSLPVTTDEKDIQSRLSSKIRHIPLLDEDGRPVDYACRSKYRSIPIMEPHLGGNELSYVTECVETSWISSQGRFVEKFEDMVAEYCGVPYALAVSNGTVALHLALEALGIGEGDEVIVPDFTFAASINAILHAGATPVLVDIREDTWLLDPEATSEAITDRTKAIMPVHLYGQPCNMDEIVRIADENGLYIVEDAAEAIGSLYHGEHVGNIGDVGTFSFYGNKTITTGEGGMVLFQDEETYQYAAQLRDHGMSSSQRYWHDEVGYNYRMTNMQAAVGVAQLERIDEIVERKIQIGERYRRELSGVEGLTLPVNIDGRKNTYWLFTAVLKDEIHIERDELISKMKMNGIDLRPVFYPLHEMPPYQKYGSSHFKVSSYISYNGVSFPSSTKLRNYEISNICEALKSSLEANRIMGITK
ncbi:perosamine synthetase [Salinibacter ruber]|uniref:aminotransferase class I/II-fold pyridoxal phosphate-dependent enzyme n=1 Tax=Salinibacter ruber TaxID=146919 RepID=UPI0021699AF5|nr:aminotransferase class I/II-fold pyridoxal phosphate-dependent enzyme [Salinibacter ruber]MCS4044617.1 perosamine synthetase [Salinibacter ruber]